jgi:hypothetical protein
MSFLHSPRTVLVNAADPRPARWFSRSANHMLTRGGRLVLNREIAAVTAEPLIHF